MHRLETTQEGKLRAACDRCHDLKNRCVRTGGPESRCDRCGRLDIDCVYRNTSRIGRPKAQRRRSVGFQPQPSWEHSYQNGSREANVNRRRDPNERLLDTPRLAANKNQAQTEVTAETETNGNTTLNESPSDVMSLLVSPEVVQQTDMDWRHIDFSHYIDAINESLCHGPTPQLPAPEPFPFPDSGGVPNTEQTTDRLLQLQGQLHRLLSATDRQPAVDYIEEGLEVTKSFLEILQAGMASHALPADSSILSTTATLPPGSNGGGEGVTTTSNCPGGDAISSANSAAGPKLHAAAGVNFIMVEQALLCYSYVLHMLDRVVGVLTTNGNQAGGVGLEPPAALSLGFFSLASQPALNAAVVLHLVLRMVQHLGELIQQLASGCKGPADRPSSSSDSAANTGGSPWEVYASSIAVTSYAMANLVGEREKALVERLSCLTSSR